MLKISPEAKAWLEKKERSAITLVRQVAKVNTCCCSTISYMDAVLGKPQKDPAEYHKETIDGIDVYFQQKIKFPEDRDVTIELSNTLGLKSLKVTGMFQGGAITA